MSWDPRDCTGHKSTKLCLLTLDNSFCGGCSVHCRMLTSSLDLYSLDVGSNLQFPSYDYRKCLQTLKISSGGRYSSFPPTENHCSRQNCPLLLLLTSLSGSQDFHLTLITSTIYQSDLLKGLIILLVKTQNLPPTPILYKHIHTTIPTLIIKSKHLTLAQKAL